ncbi:hypothetical protein SAMN02745116_00665 [Pilibacter termitis]|uniref:Mga helix-turn-helix domain-containing protein n=1 Tax=Pilibacter termitis TaxID=263852 RepID=A0A1T4LFQ2_9ENTE|nr:hypothetical protein [Pilibacter termitis]SJZ53461.1 hypothetical protein SAMN02745116_00665 [Pilibacter termitis]
MFELLENKEIIKLLMLETMQLYAVKEADIHFFERYLEDILRQFHIKMKSSRSILRYMEEISEDIQTLGLYEKIPVQLRGNALFVDLEHPMQISFLYASYLQSTIKFLLSYQTLKDNRRSLMKIRSWIETLEFENFAKHSLKSSEITLMEKRKEINLKINSRKFEINNKFTLEGNEIQIRIFLYELFHRSFCPYQMRDFMKFDNRWLYSFAKKTEILLKDFLQRTTEIFHPFSESQYLSFFAMFNISMLRAREGHFLPKRIEHRFLRLPEEFSEEMERVYHILFSYFCAEGVEKKIAEQEVRMLMNFLFIANFPRRDTTQDWLNPTFRQQLDRIWEKFVERFEENFLLPDEIKQILKTPFSLAVARYMRFEGFYIKQPLLIEEYEKNYPIAVKAVELLADIMKKYSQENRQTYDFSTQFDNIFFNQMIYPFIYGFYGKQECIHFPATKLLPKINVCVDMADNIMKNEVIRDTLSLHSGVHFHFQEIPDETTDFIITNVAPIKKETAIIFEWRFNVSEAMYQSFFKLALKLQKNRLEETAQH